MPPKSEPQRIVVKFLGKELQPTVSTSQTVSISINGKKLQAHKIQFAVHHSHTPTKVPWTVTARDLQESEAEIVYSQDHIPLGKSGPIITHILQPPSDDGGGDDDNEINTEKEFAFKLLATFFGPLESWRTVYDQPREYYNSTDWSRRNYAIGHHLTNITSTVIVSDPNPSRIILKFVPALGLSVTEAERQMQQLLSNPQIKSKSAAFEHLQNWNFEIVKLTLKFELIIPEGVLGSTELVTSLSRLSEGIPFQNSPASPIATLLDIAFAEQEREAYKLEGDLGIPYSLPLPEQLELVEKAIANATLDQTETQKHIAELESKIKSINTQIYQRTRTLQIKTQTS